MKLYKYQREGAAWLARRRRAYLADDMGLGKCVMTCVAAELARVKSALVIAPASTLPDWERTWRTDGPDVPLTAISYDRARIHFNAGTKHPAELVVLDEAHYVKNLEADRTQAALTYAYRAKRAWLLSATPMPNHPGELYAPIRVLWPEITKALELKSYWAWFKHFTNWYMSDYGPRATGAKNVEDIIPHLDKFMLRRMLSDVALQLPPLRVHTSLLPTDTKFKKELEKIGINSDWLEKRVQEDDRTASQARRFLGVYKAPLIATMVAEELRQRQYEKIVLMYYHQEVGEILRDNLASWGVAGFDGSTAVRKRAAQIKLFNEDRNTRVFVVQQSAGGTGVNLQVANELVLLEPSWSPGDNAQAIKRIHRIGSKQRCRARIFAVQGTIDEAVMESCARKIGMQTSLGLVE